MQHSLARQEVMRGRERFCMALLPGEVDQRSAESLCLLPVSRGSHRVMFAMWGGGRSGQPRSALTASAENPATGNQIQSMRDATGKHTREGAPSAAQTTFDLLCPQQLRNATVGEGKQHTSQHTEQCTLGYGLHYLTVMIATGRKCEQEL